MPCPADPLLPDREMSFQACVAAVEQQLDRAGLYFGHGTDNARDEAAWLVMTAAGIDVGGFKGDWQQTLRRSQLREVRELAKERISSRRPLAYLVNRAWFAGHEFYIDERAIVPRSHIGEWLPDQFEPWLDATGVNRVLDLCTGSGCIAVALALAFPGSQVDAADLSVAALEVASINVARHKVEDRVRLVCSDLFEELKGRCYDLIVCNPPYVSDSLIPDLPPEYLHEPAQAFAAGSDGLGIVRQLLSKARRFLADSGTLVMEVGSAAAAVESTWPEVPFTWLASTHAEPAILVLTADELDHYAGQFQ